MFRHRPAQARPGHIRPPQLNDPTLKSDWSHRAWVAGGCTTVLISLAKSVAGAAGSHMWAQIEAFQGHHKVPWTITRRQFANNLHALARAVDVGCGPHKTSFATTRFCLGSWECARGALCSASSRTRGAHTTKSRLPPLVVALQDGGLLVSRSQHAAHHRPPYNSNYCIVSGVWNEILDRSRLFEAMEMVIFFKFGVRPRSWTDPNSDWTEDAQTTSFES
ncbi:fatty acid desaturase 4 chloroplastic [Phtheirospermum japonicum]|uniref:Fatty acid desaturase 4 chloroplastic n=1 Tax=Phtheirospermum japonicum TaxID=374723 RepID=A0A830B185_9LAMI|nr:fatty acid desaturase 4 chloroplastic [Phtheirospermum japonicum]